MDELRQQIKEFIKALNKAKLPPEINTDEIKFYLRTLLPTGFQSAALREKAADKLAEFVVALRSSIG